MRPVMSPLMVPIKQKLQAAGDIVEFVMAGRGAPGVVLVGGAGAPVEGWYKIFGELAETHTVFAYNRAGIGASGKPAAPQTLDYMAETLYAALEAAAVPRPWVLVGHSLGGLIVNLFARCFPDEVAAVVLLEATAPEDVRVLPPLDNAVQRWLKRLGRRLAPPHPWAETEQLETGLAQLEAAPPFPPLPLYVVSGARYALAWATPRAQLEARARHQRDLVGLSPLGRQIIAGRSGHFPQFTEPELVRAVIGDAIRDVSS